ncbi:MAG: allophanate hydrolase subunit 1 [Propionibacteriaceae bacterium]|nr:allophanate hydrolase subunit 1 [Propionibacteriaceae bacterium]
MLAYGESAVLLECGDLDEALGVRRRLDEQRIPQIVEIIPGARTLLLRLSAGLSPAQREQLLTLDVVAPTAAAGEPIQIEVAYSGDDLEEVADLTGLSKAGVVEAHTGQVWSVGFCGFAPGFAYLQGEDERLRVPRRSSPRNRVPAGSVGLADTWSGIYPRAGPGGWQLIGRTERVLWDLDQTPPALLQPGMRVRFVQRDP